MTEQTGANSSISRFDKLLILAGLIGPALLFLSVSFLAFFYPGFNHVDWWISDLGGINSPVHTWMNLSFSLVGIFILLFSLGIFRSGEIGILGKMSALFFFATGVLMFFTGVFPSDALGMGMPTVTMIGELHNMASNYQFMTLPFAFVLFALGVANKERLRLLTPVILGTGLISLWVAYVRYFTPVLLYPGIVQRLSIGIPYLLIAVIAVALYGVRHSPASNAKQWLALVAIVFLSLAGGFVKQQMEHEKELELSGGEEIPKLHGLCSGEENCNTFCQSNRGRCTEYCRQDPENPLCQKPFAFEAVQ